eukprot:TRINITY_DN2647_c0_g1_i1.p1 TRINITY_DN2647_c0_g1~~TRINITY_DN2647_c0_g1_i1.p1  ORF type:complete len:536 (+),score=112.23 TRINITY_DN2647_c0_g1_i1:204-1811(+)
MAENWTSETLKEDGEKRKKEDEERKRLSKVQISHPAIPLPDRRPPAKTLIKGETHHSSVSETLKLSDNDPDSGCYSFSQLLAGAMASPTPNSPPVGLSGGSGANLNADSVQGHFGLSHQEVLANVTAQAKKQSQDAYPTSSSDLSPNAVTQPKPSTLNPTPLQQRPPLISGDNIQTPETQQLVVVSGDNIHTPATQQLQLVETSSEAKSQITVSRTSKASGDGYNWRKYGQKMVKGRYGSRGYYKCTHTNCLVKKKVERCVDGHVTEIVYKGKHNHEPPKKIRRSRETGSSSGDPFGGSETGDLPGENENGSDPEQQFSDDGADEEHGDEPDVKKRIQDDTITYTAPHLRTLREPTIVMQNSSEKGGLSDGYRWRKYGQKMVKGDPTPSFRSYYKCTFMGCPVRKHVERPASGLRSVIITYEGKHNHDPPPPKNSYDPPSAALLIAAAAAMSASGRGRAPNSLPDRQPSTPLSSGRGGKVAGKRPLDEGDKALESAQTLLSIGLNSNSSEADGGVKDPKVVPQTLSNEKQAPLSV